MSEQLFTIDFDRLRDRLHGVLPIVLSDSNTLGRLLGLTFKIMNTSFCTRLPFMQNFGSSVGSRAVKNFHCASVAYAEGEATEPRLTLKQIERKKFEKRSKYNFNVNSCIYASIINYM